MVKREMKTLPKDQNSGVLNRVLEARQLAIKLLANVTCTSMCVCVRVCVLGEGECCVYGV
jgi:hypothetical protein